MTHRFVALTCCALAWLVGCEVPVAGHAASAAGFGSLPLAVRDVRAASGVDEFERVIDDDQMVPDSHSPEGPCRALFDQAEAFGDTWLQFRTVADEADLDTGGPLPMVASASQTIASYPDRVAAETVFGHRLSAMAECTRLDLPFLDGVIDRPDPHTVIYKAQSWTLVSALRTDLIVDVTVAAIPDTQRVALEMSQAITERVRE